MTDMDVPLVLIADDDPEDRELLRLAFAACPLSVTLQMAADGEEALACINSGQEPDLVLLDLNMPRIDGFAVLRALRMHPEHSHLPVVVLTTSRLETHVRQVYMLGARSCLTKPSGFASLVDLVDCLCRYWFETVVLPSQKG